MITLEKLHIVIKEKRLKMSEQLQTLNASALYSLLVIIMDDEKNAIIKDDQQAISEARKRQEAIHHELKGRLRSKTWWVKKPAIK